MMQSDYNLIVTITQLVFVRWISSVVSMKNSIIVQIKHQILAVNLNEKYAIKNKHSGVNYFTLDDHRPCMFRMQVYVKVKSVFFV